MTILRKEELDFVFLWWADNDLGVILSKAYHTLVGRFYLAQSTARTWGEFLDILGDDAGYLDDFMQFDETVPRNGDVLKDLHGIWVLDNAEFPLTQCAQESFEFYGHHFPRCEGAVTIRTEYGMSLVLYPKSAYLILKAHLTQAGLRVSEEMATFPMTIHPY
jgi:hypothetical protein